MNIRVKNFDQLTIFQFWTISYREISQIGCCERCPVEGKPTASWGWLAENVLNRTLQKLIMNIYIFIKTVLSNTAFRNDIIFTL